VYNEVINPLPKYHMTPDQQESNMRPAAIPGEGFRSPETGAQPVERLPVPEMAPAERGADIGREQREKAPAFPDQQAAAARTAPRNQAADEAYAKYKQIEKVLEEDLGEIYNNLTPQEQKVFKVKGEETARSIFQLVYHKAKVKVKKIVKLIRNWLKSVPGINKFFLEQEAKIKADKIAALAGESKKIEF